MRANSYDEPGVPGGNKPAVDGDLSLLQPTETPFVSMIAKTTTYSTTPEVGADSIRLPRTTGTKEGKGATRTGNKTGARKRFMGNMHRVFDEWAVSDVQADVARKGGNYFVSDEKDYAITRTLAAMKTDMEAICLGAQEGAGGSDDDMRTRGFFKWVQVAAQAVNPVPAEYRTPTASIISLSGDRLTESTTDTGYKSFNTLLKSMKQAYGRKVDVQAFAGDDIIEYVDNFTRSQESANKRYTVNEQASSHEITLYVTIFDTSFARVSMIPDQFVNISETTWLGAPKSCALVVPEYWELMFMEELTTHDLEDEGSGPNGWVRGKFASMCKNPKGQGAILT